MITIRRAIERHHVRRRKQETWRTFHPGDQADGAADGFGALSALDEIRLSPSAGAAPSPDQGAEIVTYVLKGALAQGDSTGRSGVIHVDEFQRMTTGRVRHSERNASQKDWAHVFRLSLRPSEAELDCAHEQRLFPVAERRGVLRVVASNDGRRGSLRVHQDALVYSSIIDVGQHLIHPLRSGRIAWLHVVRGEIALAGFVLVAGDGAGVTGEPAVSFTAREDAEILLVDLGAPPA
jgi:redox-sensitive bicupin YhaK (pirin superfamily)